MPKHILIADDEAHFRYSAGIALRKAGYRTSEARSGDEALSLVLNDNSFDLLIIDIVMPRMSGMELIEALQQRGIPVPFIAISGFVDDSVLEDLFRKGCADFVDKPIEPGKFVNIIGRILRRCEGKGAAATNRSDSQMAPHHMVGGRR
ncbi:MAG: response regulator [Nitrospirae bacterium]|nr:response regulator [Nitrospirota bacterium]